MEDWLQTFLSERGLRSADSRPLYAYRCSVEEFETLTAGAKSVLDAPLRTIRSRPSMAMVLVLFAAESWRRNYNGGPWAWRLVFDALGHDPPDLPALYPIIEVGLRGWHREILLVGGSRGFLATVACEGGLPLNLVRREGAKLRRYFRSLMLDINRFQGADVSAENLAEQNQHYLPASFRQASVFELSAQLASAVLDFQGEIPEGRDNPVAFLDESQPNWRDALPLVIQDQNAEAFLKGLVRDATAAARQRPDKLKVVRRLQRADDIFELLVDLEFPKTLSVTDFAAHFDQGIEALGKRFELAIQCGDELPFVCAWATRLGDGDSAAVRLDPVRERQPRFKGMAAAGDVVLVALAGAVRLDSLAVAGGAALGDLPWAFRPAADDGSIATFIGEGTIRSRDPRVLLALSSDMTCTSESEVDPGPSVAIDGTERSIVTVRDRSMITMQTGETCHIVPGAETDSGASFRLRGAMAPVARKGGFAYLGLPDLVEDVDGRLPRTVPRHEIQWASTLESGRWVPASNQSLGVGHLRWIVHGELKFRGRLCVLPENFAVQVDDALERHCGVISITGLANTLIVSADPTAIKVTELGQGSDERRLFRISSDGHVPSACALYVRWPENFECELQVPFPGRGARFFSARGELISSGTCLTLDQLVGAKALAVSPRSHDTFDLVFRLVAADLETDLAGSANSWRRLERTRGQTKEWSFELRRIRGACESLLSVTKDLDAFVELKIEGGAAADMSCIRLRRFEFELERDEAAIWVSERALRALDSLELSQLRMDLRPITAPEDPTIELSQRVSEGQGTGQWSIADVPAESGPMLAVCSLGDWQRFRPLLVEFGAPQLPLESGDLSDGELTLAQCLRIVNRRDRREALDAMLAEISENPLHAEWAFVNSVYATFADLPPSTLDLFAAIDRSPLATVMFLLAGKASEFRQRVEFLEELPFLSHLIPLHIWVKAAKLTQHAVERRFDGVPNGEALANTVMTTKRKLFPEDQERWSLIADVFAWAIDGNLKPGTLLSLAEGGEPILQAVLNGELQALLQRHAESHWPQAHAMLDWVGQHLQNCYPNLSALWIPPPGGHAYRHSLINAPVCAALISTVGAKCPDPMLLELRLLRDFDPDWFRYAYCNVQVRAIGAQGFESLTDGNGTY